MTYTTLRPASISFEPGLLGPCETYALDVNSVQFVDVTNLEYLPLFIFVLTLTYKKENLKKKKKPNKKNVLMLEDSDGIATCHMASRKYGAWDRRAHMSSPWAAQGTWGIFTGMVLAAHTGQEFGHRVCAVMGTSHQAIASFQILHYYVIKCKLPAPEGHSLFCVIQMMTLLLKGKKKKN